MSSLTYQRAYYNDYLRASRGYLPMVDRAPAANHLRQCRELGMSFRAISLTSGVADTALRHIITRPEGRMKAGISARILAVRPRCPVTPVGVTRRIRALNRLGWTCAQIADAAGMDLARIKKWRAGPLSHARDVADGIVKAYDALSMRPARPVTRYERSSATRTMQYAIAADWPAPLAWNDDEIDNPFAVPAIADEPVDIDPVVLDLIRSGRPQVTTTAEREAIIPELNRRGMTDTEVARLIGTTPETVFRTRKRVA